MNRKILYLILVIFISGGAIQAEVAVTLNVATAGTLSTLISPSKKDLITSLTLTGRLNGDDIRCIREMAGRDGKDLPTDGSLNVLDISGVDIVAGGDGYFYDNHSKDNFISVFMFKNCNKLTSIALPNSVTALEKESFRNCNGLISITIPGYVDYIEHDAFFGCINLSQFIVDDNNTHFSDLDGVLLNKNKTELISFPNKRSVQYTIPNSVNTIKENAFFLCDNLTSVTIGNSVISIEEDAFAACYQLENITIGDKVVSIGNGAFSECIQLKSIEIGSGVTYLGSSAFDGCTNLNSITFPPNLKYINSSTFYRCTGLTSVNIPGSVNSIGELAFSRCTGLTSVNIPGSVHAIGVCAFSLTGLNEIHCQNSSPISIDSTVFSKVNKSTCKLYVPKGSYSSYWASPVWGDFTNIIEEDVTPINEINFNNASIHTADNAIIVQKTKSGEIISIYNPLGFLLKSVKASDNYIKIDVPNNQIYFVKIANNTYKVALN
jgi:hypothetical protein